MLTKSPDTVTCKQIEKLSRKRYPRLVDSEGTKWLVDEHGILFAGRPVKIVTPPSVGHIAIAITWIANHPDMFRRIRSASQLKMVIEHNGGTYITNGAACVALASIGSRLVPTQAGDVRIIHARK